MTILPRAVLTTAQLISGLTASAKNAHELATLTSDHKLKAAVNELYNALLDVRARVLDFEEENCGLRDKLAQKQEIDGPIGPFGYFFTKQKPEDPLFPKCLQSQPNKIVFLGSLQKHKGGKLRKCPVCGYDNYEEPPTSTLAFATGPSLGSSLKKYL